MIDPSKVKGRFTSTSVTETVGTATGTLSVALPKPVEAESHEAAMQRTITETTESLEALGNSEFPGVEVTRYTSRGQRTPPRLS